MQVWQNFLTQEEISSLLVIVSKLKKHASVIHGEKRCMLKLIKKISLLKLNIQSKAEIFSNAESNIDFKNPIDCSIIWTEKNASPQVWHMDAIERFAVLNIVLTTNIPTEFLDIQKTEDKFEYPLQWNLSQCLALKIKPGDGIFFWSNMIHRGPGTLKEERISLYLTFPFKNSKNSITTDFAYPNWAWIDSKFENSLTLKRSFYQIDFIISNHLLDLYPKNWHGDNIFQSVANQMEERKNYIQNYPPKNTYLVEFETTFYLANIVFNNIGVEIHYYPTVKYPQKFIEKMKFEKWEKINKILIDEKNMDEYQGYSSTYKKNYIKKENILIYLFSHLVLKESDIAIPKIFPMVYIHHELITVAQIT